MLAMTVTVSDTLKKLAKTNKTTLSKRVHDRLSAAWRRAIREWIRVVLLNTLKDTGMSQGSLIPLGRAVRALRKTQASARGGKPKPNQSFHGSWSNQPAVKSRAEGEKLGVDAYTVSVGTPAKPVFNFQFEIPVFQWFLHENGMGKFGPGAQNALPKASAAFHFSITRDYAKMGVDIKKFFAFGIVIPRDNNE